jgi:hypothetical protein
MVSWHFFQQRQREQLAQLLPLALLVPSAYPAPGSGSSGREDKGKYILLTSLKPDAWLCMSAVRMGVVRKAHGA